MSPGSHARSNCKDRRRERDPRGKRPDARLLRLARRVPLGLARTGTTGSHFSGDLFVAFSTANAEAFTPGWRALRGERQGSYDTLRFIPWGFLDTFYEAVVRSVEEAVLNALVANEEMTGYRGRRVPALPREKIAELVKARPSPV